MGPSVYTFTINKSSNLHNYEAMKINVGPFQVLTAPALPPQQAGTSAVAPTLGDVAKLMTKKENGKENRRVKKGFLYCPVLLSQAM